MSLASPEPERQLPPGPPRWKRRKAARPAELIAAAREVFAERGYSAAKLEDIAARAGVSKGAMYLYFETKQALFEAVIREAVAPELHALDRALLEHTGPFDQAIRAMLDQAAELLLSPHMGGLLRLVIAEARNHPEVTRIWFDATMAHGLEIMTGVIARAQARGEVRPGDPRHLALTLFSPFLLECLWRESFQPVGAGAIDPSELARDAVEVFLRGVRP